MKARALLPAISAALVMTLLVGCRSEAQPAGAGTFAGDSERIHKAFRDAGIAEPPGTVRPAEDGFLYAEVAGRPVFFRVVGERVYILTGNVIRVEGGSVTHLSRDRENARNRGLLERVDPREAVVFGPKADPKGRVYVFTDPSCAYCARFHKDVPALVQGGLEVVYLALPRMGMDSEAGKALQAVWCSADRNATLSRTFSAGMPAVIGAAGRCDDGGIVARHARLAEELRVTGTPAIYLPSGERLGGYLPPRDLLARAIPPKS